jgi:hypothetical protein
LDFYETSKLHKEKGDEGHIVTMMSKDSGTITYTNKTTYQTSRQFSDRLDGSICHPTFGLQEQSMISPKSGSAS